MSGLNLTITFDEETLREIVEDAVAALKREGYIWRDIEEEAEEEGNG